MPGTMQWLHLHDGTLTNAQTVFVLHWPAYLEYIFQVGGATPSCQANFIHLKAYAIILIAPDNILFTHQFIPDRHFIHAQTHSRLIPDKFQIMGTSLKENKVCYLEFQYNILFSWREMQDCYLEFQYCIPCSPIVSEYFELVFAKSV